MGTSTRGATIFMEKLNIDQGSLSRTPTVCIKFLYLLKPARGAYIKILGEDSQILAANWLLWLNENSLASLANFIPLLDQLPTEVM